MPNQPKFPIFRVSITRVSLYRLLIVAYAISVSLSLSFQFLAEKHTNTAYGTLDEKRRRKKGVETTQFIGTGMVCHVFTLKTREHARMQNSILQMVFVKIYLLTKIFYVRVRLTIVPKKCPPNFAIQRFACQFGQSLCLSTQHHSPRTHHKFTALLEKKQRSWLTPPPPTQKWAPWVKFTICGVLPAI